MNHGFKRRSMRLRRNKGQSTVEYLVVAGLVTALMATPILGRRSVVEYFMDMVREGWARFLAALSLPV